MAAPAQPVNTPTLDRFVAALKPIALKHNIAQLVIIGRDPVTNEPRVYGDKDNAELRALVAEKFGLYDGGETGWE